ncbi:MAG TPA: hypothetical protein VGM05_03870 [Planctomycetaceae bacterium]|jgi:hypothetical protein
MTSEKKTHLAAPLMALGGASVLAAAIVVAAPEVGMVTLASMIAAWVALGVVRLVILVGIARQFYLNIHTARAS